MNANQLAEIVDAHRDDRESTHWDGCHLTHPGCAVQVLADEVESLNERVATLARALVVAAQHERDRLATADHQRAVADGWLDLARSALPPLPTVAEMAGAFEGGPDSVEWLREQRASHDQDDGRERDDA